MEKVTKSDAFRNAIVNAEHVEDITLQDVGDLDLNTKYCVDWSCLSQFRAGHVAGTGNT